MTYRLPFGSSRLRSVVFVLLFVSSVEWTVARIPATQMSPRIVDTQYGKIRGVLITLPSRVLPVVEAYYGLQYASVLGGELRFMPPTSPMEKWDGIRVAHRYRPVCPQRLPDLDELEQRLPVARVDHFRRILPHIERQQEECLNLNIVFPARAKNETSLLPVVVFIHGETFEIGTGNAYDGSVLAAKGQIMVVTLNYRLGIFGYLSTEDSSASGNYALLDQVAALHWIKENIMAFGGDPNEVTLLGQGYGGVLVNLLLISPVTKDKGLFKRAIIQSGSALSSWAITSDPLRYARELASRVNCSAEALTENARLVHCLKQRPWEELTKVDISAPKYFSPFGPTVDQRSFLPDDVRHLMGRRTDAVFASTPLLIGVMKNEGQLFLSPQDLNDGLTELQTKRMLRTFVRNVFSFHRQKIYDIIAYHYSDWEKPRDPYVTRDNMMDFLGDSQFAAPTIELARYHSDLDAPTYLYAFGQQPSKLEAQPQWGTGSVHGDDLIYVFGAPLVDGTDPFGSTYGRSERVLSEYVIRYWTNFIKTGNPNDPGTSSSEELSRGSKAGYTNWPTYTIDTQEFLVFDRKSLERNDEGWFKLGVVTLRDRIRPNLMSTIRGAKLALWLDLIPRIHRSDSLNARYHLLDQFDNRSSFEDEGTKEIRMNDDDVEGMTMMSAVAATSEEPPAKMTMTMSKGTADQHQTPLDPSIMTTLKPHRLNATLLSSISSTEPHPPHPPHPNRLLTTSASLLSAPVVSTTARRVTTRARPLTTSAFSPRLLVSNPGGGVGGAGGGTGGGAGGSRDLNLPLSVTIAVGCTLLLLNILIFIVTYRQKSKQDKMSADDTDDISKQGPAAAAAGGGGGGGMGMGMKMASGDESDNLRSSTGPDSDTNSSISSFSARLAAEESRQAHQQQHLQHHLQQPQHYLQQQLPRNVHFSSTTLSKSPCPTPPRPPTADAEALSSYVVTLPSSSSSSISKRPPAVPARQTTKPHHLLILSSHSSTAAADDQSIRRQSSTESKQSYVFNNGNPSTTV